MQDMSTHIVDRANGIRVYHLPDWLKLGRGLGPTDWLNLGIDGVGGVLELEYPFLLVRSKAGVVGVGGNESAVSVGEACFEAR